MKFFIPSKTFFIGEYAVLSGGCAVVACTRPVFEVGRGLESPNPAGRATGRFGDLHPESPAGKAVLRMNVNPEGNWSFFDPNGGRGGFGGSTAEWLGVQLLNSREREVWRLWSLYRQDVASSLTQRAGSGPVPSGADVVAQLTGGLAVVDLEKHLSRGWDWPFLDQHFLIFRTGLKLQTHHHLAELKGMRTLELARISKEFIDAFEAGDFESCCDAMNRFYEELSRQKLVDLRIAKLIQQLEPEVSAIKGCGAMGVDTIVCLVTGSQRPQALAAARGLGLEFIAGDQDLTKGAFVEMLQDGTAAW